MKRVVSIVAVALLVVGIGFKIYNDPEVQKRLPANVATQTNNADRWATALCQRDAATLSRLSGGVIAGTVEEIEGILAGFSFTCSGSRLLGVVHGEYGDEYFYALNMGDYEVWYGLTLEDGLVIDVE